MLLLQQARFLLHLGLNTITLLLQLNKVKVPFLAKLLRTEPNDVDLLLLLAKLGRLPVESLHSDLLLLFVAL